MKRLPRSATRNDKILLSGLNFLFGFLVFIGDMIEIIELLARIAELAIKCLSRELNKMALINFEQ